MNFENERADRHQKLETTERETVPSAAGSQSKLTAPDALSFTSSLNYYVPSDSEIDDDLMDGLNNMLMPKIPE